MQKLIVGRDVLKSLRQRRIAMPSRDTLDRTACSAHVDTFALRPPAARDLWPEFLFDRPELRYPPRLNARNRAPRRRAGAGLGRAAPRSSRREDPLDLRELHERANRIARVLVEDLGLVPGNRVLLRGPNSPAMAACWFAVVKAGGIAVATMPLLRARELAQIVDKARISHALCDARLPAELDAARGLPDDERRRSRFGTMPGRREAASTRSPRASRGPSPTSTPRPTTSR